VAAPRVLILSASIGEGHDLPARVIADGLRALRPGFNTGDSSDPQAVHAKTSPESQSG